ncbi:Nucleoside transporter [Giardia muris]|uniref:Nucleoside transporter n=1 Tax=Giardia muris TaxID=5742 RepID=A0A4Z1SQM9_GIAMU|nr:Nucleoside transporter [Giardia muris]|eukprot:TNJ27990.1 Nucleoside transporter [Giardia muris]
MEQELDRRMDSSALGTVGTLDEGIQEKEATGQKRLGCGMYFIFVLLGTAILMPFNCFITPGDYVFAFYPGDLYFSLCSSLNNVGNWSMMWVMLKFGHKLNANVMVQVSLVVWLVALVMTPLVAIIIKDGGDPGTPEDDRVRSIRMGITGCLILICGAFNGVAFPMTFSVASRLSWDMCQAIMNGNGVAGIVAVLINIIVTGVGMAIKSSNGNSYDDRNFLRYATLAYFVISGILVGSCIIAWNIVMKRFPELKHDIHEDASAGQGVVDPSELNPKTGRRYTTVEISRHLVVPGIAVFLVFFITLSLFPQITNMAGVFFYYRGNMIGNDTFHDKGLSPSSFTWWNLGLTANFMVGDWIGRAIPKIEVLSRIKVVPILIFSCCRFVFLPLFLLFAVPRSTDGLTTAPALVKPFCESAGNCSNKGVIGADVIVQIIMLIFAITNGYVGSVAMVRFVDCLPHMSYAGDGGRVMSLFLNTGLFFGSFTSLAISLLLSG